ncbi:MAG: TerB family tellurite resistance protein [Alphaproteobacteria bacterium]|nr:TerB family tellurite resistance protein [Alphaproteobacteria bacterium]
MSYWGKIIGGAAGYALGGPLGAILGAAAGHAVDEIRAETTTEVATVEDRTRSVAFTIAVVALAAKMARADGEVSNAEIAAFRRLFRVDPEEEANVRWVFDRARRSAAGFEAYAQQIAAMFPNEPEVLEELIEALFVIARADGTPGEAELAYLRQVAAIFGLETSCFRRVCAEHLAPPEQDPYTLLGVSSKDDDDAIKAAHRRLVRDNHPDRLVAQGLPREMVQVANDKLAKINAAYDAIRAQRARAPAPA